ncbi:MAG: hypothetical protein LBH60_07025 [Prevotellaceae bacterium]|nr:hypothetical protein [Prevotellaceae bacterium]
MLHGQETAGWGRAVSVIAGLTRNLNPHLYDVWRIAGQARNDGWCRRHDDSLSVPVTTLRPCPVSATTPSRSLRLLSPSLLA